MSPAARVANLVTAGIPIEQPGPIQVEGCRAFGSPSRLRRLRWLHWPTGLSRSADGHPHGHPSQNRRQFARLLRTVCLASTRTCDALALASLPTASHFDALSSDAGSFRYNAHPLPALIDAFPTPILVPSWTDRDLARHTESHRVSGPGLICSADYAPPHLPIGSVKRGAFPWADADCSAKRMLRKPQVAFDVWSSSAM
jgi:hypothetical protein